MIRQPARAASETPFEDRSMRVIEYGMAVVAAIAAVILAFVR